MAQVQSTRQCFAGPVATEPASPIRTGCAVLPGIAFDNRKVVGSVGDQRECRGSGRDNSPRRRS